jgi:hypothetical protein
MDRGLSVRPILRILAIAVAATMLASMSAPGVFAQTPAATLMTPKGQSKSSRSTPAKTAPARRVNPCSIYGEGFAYVPGTDTCVKVGGYVRSDVGVNFGH